MLGNELRCLGRHDWPGLADECQACTRRTAARTALAYLAPRQIGGRCMDRRSEGHVPSMRGALGAPVSRGLGGCCPLPGQREVSTATVTPKEA